MRRLIFLVGLGVLAGAGWYLWPRPQPDIQTIAANEPIVFYGDSLVYGTGADPGNDLPSLLAERLEHPVRNSGMPGATTADGVEHLESRVLQHDPGLVLLLLGGNDVLQKMPPAETFANLGEIIDRIHEHDAQVLLVGVRGGLLYDSYGDDYAALAREKNVRYVSDILDDIFTDPALKADRVHPNSEGYRRMAERLAPVVEEYLRKKK